MRGRDLGTLPVELKHLRYADAASQHGSFRKAADALGVKQSNLSRRIRIYIDRRVVGAVGFWSDERDIGF